MTAAVILGGGRARRLDGADKAAVEVAGGPLVDRVYAAVRACDPVIAVGPATLARAGLRVVREEPPWSGPAAAVAAGVAALPADGAADAETWLLACDLPRAGELVALVDAIPIPRDSDAVVATDGDGRMQWLAGRYRIAALRRALSTRGSFDGVSMRDLLAPLRLTPVPVGDAALDLDTWDAIADYRRNEKEGS